MMKQKLSPTMIRMILFVGLALIAVFSISEFALEDSTPQKTRGPASIESTKPVGSKSWGHSLPKGDPHFSSGKNRELPIKHTEKMVAPVKIEWVLNGSAPSGTGDEFSLTAIIQSHYDQKSIQVEWILPEGVKLVSGSLKDTLYNLTAYEKQEVTGLFLQTSDVNEQVHLRVKSLDAEVPFGLSAQFNTLDQGDIDESIAALKQRSHEDMEKQKAKMVK